MEDDTGASEDERAIELSSIEAIFPELKINPEKPFAATLEIPVALQRPLKISFQAAADGTAPQLPTPPTSVEAESNDTNVTNYGTAAPIDSHILSHLPPITINIFLPQGYPAEKPPFVQLFVTPRWLPTETLKTLQDDCGKLWEELGRDQVVYAYIDHIQQAAEKAFELADSKQGCFELSSNLKLVLLDYDLQCKRELFDKKTFDCGICLEPKKGIKCHRMLLCQHVFCVGCLQDFYNNCITEGDVDNVKCLSPGCGKDDVTTSASGKRRKRDRTLNPSELLQIPLEQDVVKRYVYLKRKKKLEADENTVYCPRQWCQGAARSKKHPKPVDPFNDFESESEEESQPVRRRKRDPESIPPEERLCVCEDCNFAFCCVCKKGWHGPLGRCNPRRQAELNAEEKASLDYLKRFSTPCPTCNAPSQKTHGCNHMICFKCNTHFCYLCSSWLMPDNPYVHFNDHKSPCHMRLWELEGGDGADAGIDHGDAAGRAPVWEPDAAELAEFDLDSEEDSDEDDFDQDLAELAGEDLVAMHSEDESSEDEPAPDQRRPERNRHIEIVNFAGNGVNHRIELPERPHVPPPAVPDPPIVAIARRRRGHGQQGNRQRALQREPHRQQPVPPREDLIQAARQHFAADLVPNGRPANGMNVEEAVALLAGDLPRAAPGQGDRVHDNMPAPVRAMGLERFLELARNDMEDEWDSDELDEDDIEIAVMQPAPRPARGADRRNR